MNIQDIKGDPQDSTENNCACHVLKYIKKDIKKRCQKDFNFTGSTQ